MKHISSFMVVFIVLGVVSCQKPKPKGVLDKETYKKVMHDILLANVLKDELSSRDHKHIKTLPIIYKQYHIDSLQLAKSVEYYSHKPEFLVEVYQSIKDTYQKKIDSIEKSNPAKKKPKPKSDTVIVKKEILKGLKNTPEKILKNKTKQ